LKSTSKKRHGFIWLLKKETFWHSPTLNDEISLVNYGSFNSARKVNVDESFASSTFKPGRALPKVRWLGFFYCNFAEILFASMCLGKNCIMPFFANGHRLG